MFLFLIPSQVLWTRFAPKAPPSVRDLEKQDLCRNEEMFHKDCGESDLISLSVSPTKPDNVS